MAVLISLDNPEQIKVPQFRIVDRNEVGAYVRTRGGRRYWSKESKDGETKYFEIFDGKFREVVRKPKSRVLGLPCNGNEI